MVTKTTHEYANHGIKLECDVYEPAEVPSTNPCFLFFHSGGLVGGARDCVPPWLVQACLQRAWPLISPSYRLLPQAGGAGLVEDALAAYDFAISWKATDSAKRRVVVGGASAGFFMAALVAHHVRQAPSPEALFCITGIPTFQHPFFKMSVLLTPEPIKDEEVEAFKTGPALAGTRLDSDWAFSTRQLLSSGLKDPSYKSTTKSVVADETNEMDRNCLYDYYLYNNSYASLVGAVDPGFEWAKAESSRERVQAWPRSIFVQGDDDPDVSMDVTTHAVDCLGPQKATLCLAKNQGHLFEAKSYLEDVGDAMDVVRQALALLDQHLAR